MPLAKAQNLLKKVLPEKIFESLYNQACNAYDVYQSVKDNIYYNIPTVNIEDNIRRLILRSVSPHTMTSRVGLLATYDKVMQIEQEGLEGNIVECGVARGGCAAMMALIASNYGNKREVWLFDSFEGLPDQTVQDGIQKPIRHQDKTANDLAKGYCLGTITDVENLLYEKLRLDPLKVKTVEGWFQDTLPVSRTTIGKIALLRLDGDWYESTKCCLENLYDNVITGGWVIIDDYQLPGCEKAVDEFLLNQSSVFMSFDANGRAYWRKI